MLFDLRPKTSLEDLFDRLDERKSFEDDLYNYPMIIVTGLRRVGKSSLTRTMLNELEFPYLFLDGRSLYASAGGQIGHINFVSALERELSKLSVKFRIGSYMKRVKGISVSGGGVSIDWKETDLSTLFEQINNFSEKCGKDFVLYIDEAQYLRFYGSRGGKDLLALISHIYDNLKHIKTVITGSEIGLLHDFLDFDSYTSPLFGRAYNEISVRPFKPEVTKEFLKRGFAEINMRMDFDLDLAVERLDGIPGYLVLFGNKYRENPEFEEAVFQVGQTMRGMIEGELKELERRSPRYIAALKYVASGIDSWSRLKRIFIADGDNIGDSRLHETLNTLQITSWIEKDKDSKYKIVDPVLERILKD